MFRAIKALFNARKGFRWSLYFVHKHEGLRYALHENAVTVLLGYVLAPIEVGKRISPDWELHVNCNFEHKAIRLVEEYFSDGDLSKELFDQIAAIDSGWMVPGGEPVFEDACTRKQLSLGVRGWTFLNHAQRGTAIEAQLDSMWEGNEHNEDVTLDSVLGKAFYRP